MRSPGLLVVGLALLVVGVVGMLVIAPPTAFGDAWAAPMGVPGMHAMAGVMGGPVPPDAAPIGIDQASAAAEDYVARFGDPNLALGEVMEFLADYYIPVIERDTGMHAFELLVDKYTGVVFPEMGPNLVWNTRYGMMGPAAGWRPFASADVAIGPEEAQGLARQYLETQGLRLDVAEPERFYGYYTLHTVRDGQIEGMLSVHERTGQVWYHVWHGPFIQRRGPPAQARQGR